MVTEGFQSPTLILKTPLLLKRFPDTIVSLLAWQVIPKVFFIMVV
jgi:hypothetical protein